MATLGGDLLRMLAHGVINTGVSAGSTLLSNYLKPGMEVKEAFGKGLLDVAGTGSLVDRTAAQEALRKFGVDIPSVNQTNPAGTEVVSQEGAKLTAPSLAGLAPELSPVTAPMRLSSSLDKTKAAALSSLPIPVQQDILTKDPDREMKMLQMLALQGDKEAGRRLQELQITQNGIYQQGMLEARKQHDDTMRIMGEGNQAIRQQALIQSIAHQKATLGMMGDKLEAGARKQLEDGIVKVGKVTGNMMSTEDQIKTSMNEYNALHGSIMAKHPELSQHFQPLEPVLSQPFLGFGGGAVRGVKQKEGAPAPTAKQEVAPTTLTFPRRVKVKGNETVVNSQEEYNALQRGLVK